jgi:hypothetical protein
MVYGLWFWVLVVPDTGLIFLHARAHVDSAEGNAGGGVEGWE